MSISTGHASMFQGFEGQPSQDKHSFFGKAMVAMGRSRMVMLIREKKKTRSVVARCDLGGSRRVCLPCQGQILTRLYVDSGFSTLVEDLRSQIPR